MRNALIAAAILAAGAAAPAAATTITFEEFGSGFDCSYQTGIQSGGMRFNTGEYLCAVYGPGNGYVDWPVENHGSNLIGIGYSDSTGTMARTDDSQFSLESFQAGAGVFGPEVMTLTVTGILAAGGSLTATLSIERDFQTFAMTGWTGLSSVVFQTTGVGYFGLDNIVYDEPADVPEPAMLGLFGLGALGLGLSRRRKAA